QRAPGSRTIHLLMPSLHLERRLDPRKTVLAACFGLACGTAPAQQAQQAQPTYSSPEQAQQAIDQAVRERAALEERSVREQRLCYDKFLTTACLDRVRERRRVGMANLRDTEVAARAWLRKDKADRRDVALEEKRVADERDALERAADV